VSKKILLMPVIGAVIRRKRENGVWEVLLVRRPSYDKWPLVWEFPRGKCEFDKTLKQCLKREVKEEVGLDVVIERFIDTYEYVADEGKRRSKQYNFLCSLLDEKQQVVLDQKEHDQHKWVASMGEVELLAVPEMKKTLSKVLNVSSQTSSYPKTSAQKIAEFLDKMWRKT